jgi:hypothetical protein
MRTSALQAVRAEWKATSRFVMGRAKVMQVGLGRGESEAVEPGWVLGGGCWYQSIGLEMGYTMVQK